MTRELAWMVATAAGHAGAEKARAAIAQDGATYIDRFGAPRTRPEIAIERDSRQAFARLLAQLDLRPPSPFDF